MDENTQAKFDEKLKSLLAIAKKKKNVLDQKEILDMFADEDLSSEKLDYIYDFLESNRLSLTLGAACNKSCYTGYESGFGICNVELKYTYTVAFKNGWSLPLNVAYIINPVMEKSFVNFSTSFAF